MKRKTSSTLLNPAIYLSLPFPSLAFLGGLQLSPFVLSLPWSAAQKRACTFCSIPACPRPPHPSFALISWPQGLQLLLGLLFSKQTKITLGLLTLSQGSPHRPHTFPWRSPPIPNWAGILNKLRTEPGNPARGFGIVQ